VGTNHRADHHTAEGGKKAVKRRLERPCPGKKNCERSKKADGKIPCSRLIIGQGGRPNLYESSQKNGGNMRYRRELGTFEGRRLGRRV